jgi:hypothetical protein
MTMYPPTGIDETVVNWKVYVQTLLTIILFAETATPVRELGIAKMPIYPKI